MKYYIVYRKNKFIAYTTSFDMLKQFLETRRHIKYMVKIIKEKNIPKEILDNPFLSEYEMTYYQGYSLTTELVLTENERTNLDYSMCEYSEQSYYILGELLELIKLMRFNDTEKIQIQNMIDYLINLVGYVSEESVFDDVFDVIKYFNKYVLDREDTVVPFQ